MLIGSLRGALAQDSTRTWSLGADNQSGVYVGMAVSSTFRLEPEVSVVRSRDKAVITVDNGFGSVSTFNGDRRLLRVLRADAHQSRAADGQVLLVSVLGPGNGLAPSGDEQ